MKDDDDAGGLCFGVLCLVLLVLFLALPSCVPLEPLPEGYTYAPPQDHRPWYLKPQPVVVVDE